MTVSFIIGRIKERRLHQRHIRGTNWN